MQSICDGDPERRVCTWDGQRSTLTAIRVASVGGNKSMLRPFVREAPLGARQIRGGGRRDLAMNVLQYGTAIVAIVVVTLLGLLR
jgi:hypothetical protein